MRLLMMLFGLVLVGLAGLWFFTPVLDQPYARHAPKLAHSRSVSSAPSSPQSTQRGAGQRPAVQASASPIASKNIFDNAMSMINAGTGLLGLWFGWMSYRLQVRDGRRNRQ